MRAVGVKGCRLTRSQEVARLVHSSEEQLESDDGVNDNDEEHQQGNVQKRHKRLHDGIEHYVQTCGGEGQAQLSSPSARRPSSNLVAGYTYSGPQTLALVVVAP